MDDLSPPLGAHGAVQADKSETVLSGERDDNAKSSVGRDELTGGATGEEESPRFLPERRLHDAEEAREL